MNDTLFQKAVSLTYGYENYLIYPDYVQGLGSVYYVVLDNDLDYSAGTFHFSESSIAYRLYTSNGFTFIENYRFPGVTSNHFYYSTVGLYSPAYPSAKNFFDALDHDSLAMFCSLALGFAVIMCYFIRLIWVKH